MRRLSLQRKKIRMFLLTVEEVKESFNENNRVFWKFRDVWDGYRYYRNKDWSFVSILQELQKDFSNNFYLKKKKPLRSFKIYSTEKSVTRDRIYSDWLVYLNEDIVSDSGRTTTIFKETMRHAEKKMKEEDLCYTYEQLVIAFSTMLWQCAEGVRLEVKAVNKLKELYQRDNIIIDFSSDEDEDTGSDCYFYNPKNKHRLDVSIKCLKSLNTKTAEYLMNKKNPNNLFLCGFRDGDAEDLMYFIPKRNESHKFFKNVIPINETDNIFIV